MNSAFLAGMIGSLLFSIFFSGIEVAYLSANKEQIALRGQSGNLAAKIITFFTRKPTWFIGTTLIGNIASLTLFGVFTTLTLLSWYELEFSAISLPVLIPIIVLTFILSVIILYTVEFFSKSFFIINSNKMLTWLTFPFVGIFVVLFPHCLYRDLACEAVHQHSVRSRVFKRAAGIRAHRCKPVFEDYAPGETKRPGSGCRQKNISKCP